MAALHRHVRDELLQVIVGDVLEGGERVPAVIVEGGSVRGQVVGCEERLFSLNNILSAGIVI